MGSDLNVSFLKTSIHGSQGTMQAPKRGKQPIVLQAIMATNCNNDQHATITLMVQYWHTYFGSHQKLSNWT